MTTQLTVATDPAQKFRFAIGLIGYGASAYSFLILFSRLFGDEFLNIHGFSGLFWLLGVLASAIAAVTGVLFGIALLILRSELRSPKNELIVLMGAVAMSVLVYSMFLSKVSVNFPFRTKPYRT